MPDEARLEDGKPVTDGWFVVNVRDAAWRTSPDFGSSCRFEGPEAEFPQLGINVRVLEPGKPNCLYHRESPQEDLLVLSGECLLLVEGEERPLRAWDFVHLPPLTDHVLVGAGDGPCVVVMVGARPDEELVYPVSELAARYGASVEAETHSGDEAYARSAPTESRRPDTWDALPWA